MTVPFSSIEDLLKLFLSPDNDTRNQAESAYESLPNDKKINQLLHVYQDFNKEIEIRKLSAVLIRRILTNPSVDAYTSLSPDLQNLLKQSVLYTIKNEKDEGLRKKSSDIIAEISRLSIDDDGNNNWPEVLNYMCEAANSPIVIFRESVFNILASFPSIFASEEPDKIMLIKQIIASGLAENQPKNIKLSATKAFTAFVIDHDKETSVLTKFSDLIPLLLKIIAEDHAKLISNLNDSTNGEYFEEEEESCLKCLVELCDSAPKFLRPQLSPLLEVCVKIISDPQPIEDVKLLALECIVSLSENAAPMFRKFLNHHPNFLQILIPHILRMMAQLSDDVRAWSLHLTDENDHLDGDYEADDFDEDQTSSEAETALDRMACALGGKTFLSPLLASISPMLQNADWKQRHAGLMALGAVGEGCTKQMEAMMANVVDGILAFFTDPHPRVRYAACNAIGQMAADFSPIFEKKFHDKVIPGLITVLDDVQNPKVQAHSAAALVNFCEECPQNVINQHLDALLSKCQTVLTQNTGELFESLPSLTQQSQSGDGARFANAKKKILEQITTAIASIADSAKSAFVPYYQKFVPCLKFIVQKTTSLVQSSDGASSQQTLLNAGSFSLLRGKAIECLTLIGMAVGKETFIPDCHDIMTLLLPLQTGQLKVADDDPQLSYLISAWARMCSIMGTEFVQYLPAVMGPVLQTASFKPEIALVDSETAKDATANMGGDWQFVNFGDQQNFGLKTAGLEDKATACQMLVCYARELKQDFAPWVDQVLSVMVPMLKFYFHDGVRTAASECMPYLLDCARGKGPEYLTKVWLHICPELLKALESEPEPEVLAEHLGTFGQCIEKLGNGCVTAEMPEVMRIVDKLFKAHFDKEHERLEKRKDEDYDEVVEENLSLEVDDDTYTLSKLCDLVHGLYKAYGTDFNPTFTTAILPHALNLMQVGRPWSDHQWGICIVDDFIEFSGTASFAYKDSFLPYLANFLSDSSPEVRQAAAYGVGVMALCPGPVYAQVCTELIPLLKQMINGSDSRSAENGCATENAISAVTKIMKNVVQPLADTGTSSGSVELTSLLSEWLSWLPVVEDVEEASHIYSFLCDLIESNNSIILGANNSNIPRLIGVIAEAFEKKVVDHSDVVGKRMINIVKQLQGNTELFGHCVSILSESQRGTLQNLLSMSTT